MKFMFLKFEKDVCNWGESCNWDTNLVYSRGKIGVFYEFFWELNPLRAWTQVVETQH